MSKLPAWVKTGIANCKSFISLITLAGFVSAQSSGCAQEKAPASEAGTEPNQNANQERLRLIFQLRQEGIRDERVLAAMSQVPRHSFVPPDLRRSSYENGPLPIGKGQTISQPYVVAYMTECLDLSPEDRVLEVGTGSGYQSAILSHLVKRVYSVEIIPELATQAEKTLSSLGIKNVCVKVGDGYKGWSDESPFDAIIVTAAPPEIPPLLIEQLKPGGRLVVPAGKADMQWLVKVTKHKDGTTGSEKLIPVRFVPMIPAP